MDRQTGRRERGGERTGVSQRRRQGGRGKKGRREASKDGERYRQTGREGG